jgi:hypothetical protein
METGKAIYKLLKDSVAVGAICGDRIYPELAQQDAVTPFIVYTVTDTTPSGTKNATSKLDTARVELYCIADDYETGMSLGIEVRSALDRQSGTINGVEVQSIDFDTSDIQFEPDQRFYILEQTYDVRIQRTGTAVSVAQFPGNTFTVEEVDGDPSGAVNKLVVSNGTLTIAGNTATIDTGGGADVQYHDRYSTEAESERSGATATLEIYYTARPDGDGYAESEVSDVGETDTINRTLYYSDKFQADPDTAGDWTQYTTQPADNATFATAKAALLAGLNETDATAETRGTLPLSLKMVRTTTAAAGDLLLDTYTGSAVAFSVRKLDKDYVGYCMKVREDSGDTEADIGFDSNGDLDTAAIATHCGSANGYVVTWYDQSGNSNNATQSSEGNQPQIYNGTAVITENGKPAVKFFWEVGNQNSMRMTSEESIEFFTHSMVYNQNEATRFNFMSSGGLVNYYRLESNGSMYLIKSGDFDFATGAIGTSGYALRILIRDTSSTATAYVDGSSSNAWTGLDSSNFRFIAIDGNYSAAAAGRYVNHQEFIIWSDAKNSTDRTGIETDLNTYFSIF